MKYLGAFFLFLYLLLPGPLVANEANSEGANNLIVPLEMLLLSVKKNNAHYIVRAKIDMQAYTTSDWEEMIRLRPKLAGVCLEELYALFSRELQSKDANIGKGNLSIESINAALYFKSKALFKKDVQYRVLVKELTLQKR